MRSMDWNRRIGGFVPFVKTRSRSIEFGKTYDFIEPLAQGGYRGVDVVDDLLLFDLTYEAAQLNTVLS
jgi:hypothetical protein